MTRSLCLVIALAAAAPAAAAVYHESVDAGALPLLAEDVVFTDPLEAIEGGIVHAFDADLYRIHIDDPAAFSARATVVAGMAPSVQLFVFDRFGLGVVAALTNDNWFASPLSQIPSGTLQGRPAGDYLLGVAPPGSHPLAPSSERIFPDVASGLSEPVGLLRFAPIFDWTRDYTDVGGNYLIELIGASAVSQPLVLLGDYNQNGTVDAADYVLWRNNLGSGTSLPNDDTPGVGQDDYTRWRAHFGQTAGSGSGTTLPSVESLSAAVPEPTTLWLVLLGVVMITARRPQEVLNS